MHTPTFRFQEKSGNRSKARASVRNGDFGKRERRNLERRIGVRVFGSDSDQRFEQIDEVRAERRPFHRMQNFSVFRIHSLHANTHLAADRAAT